MQNTSSNYYWIIKIFYWAFCNTSSIRSWSISDSSYEATRITLVIKRIRSFRRTFSTGICIKNSVHSKRAFSQANSLIHNEFCIIRRITIWETNSIIHFNTIKYHNAKELWIDKCSPLPPWCPIWLPINLISDIAVPISLSLRLFANVLSGTIVMALVYGLLSKVAIIWPAVLHVYFDLFSGAIQTYVFCMLSMTYVTQAIDGRD